MSEEILKKQNAMIDKALDDAFNAKLDQKSYDIFKEMIEWVKEYNKNFFDTKEPKYDKRFCCAPISFTDEAKWNAIPDEMKMQSMKNLWAYASMMTIDNAIQLLCHTVTDMQKRIEELEKKIPQNS